MSDKATLVAMRVMNIHKTHPRADYSHKCACCQALVCLYPSSQKMLRANPGVEIICDECFRPNEFDIGIPVPGAFQEMRESVDFTKKKV